MLLLSVLSLETFAQISPGELTKAHAKFEGLSNCTKCHVLGGHVTSSKCLDCHTEIRRSQSLNKGFHSGSSIKGKDCWYCHSEHHGRNFKIIKFDESNFNHKTTGFELTGKHASARCGECHQQKNVTLNEVKNRSNTFLGLDERCTSCHEDFHQKTLGDNCLKCHNTEKFKPASGFSHNQAKFRLIGAHTSVDCSKCHVKEKRNGHDFQRFTGLNFTNCTPCHKDIHQGKFGRDCQKCHSVTSFKSINKTAFDHSKTNFPLLGRHASLGCQDCHIKGDFTKKLSFARCTDCHADFHKGQFAKKDFRSDCKDCHTVNGFRPSTFSLEDHNKLKFALSGSHKAVDCRACHQKNNEWHFNIESSRCTACHTNVHGNELTAKYLGDNRCENCHNDHSWKVVNFDHKQTRFELAGKHESAECKACHYNDQTRQYKFSSLTTNCERCHKDIHQGQFAAVDKSECARCHTFNNWKPTGFDHELTRFSLLGAHQNVPCASCHPKVQTAEVTFTKYKLTDFKCANCHRA